MLLLIAFIILLALSILVIKIGEGGWAVLLLTFVVFVATTIQSAMDPMEQKNDYNKLLMLNSNRLIIENKYEEIGTNLRSELSKYIEHEKAIFDKLTPETISFYFAKYPELKGVESVTMLARELAKLQSKIFDIDIKYNAVVLIIKKRQENKFVYSPFTPKFEVEFKK